MLLGLRLLFHGSWKSTGKTNRQCHVVTVIAYLIWYNNEIKQYLPVYNLLISRNQCEK